MYQRPPDAAWNGQGEEDIDYCQQNDQIKNKMWPSTCIIRRHYMSLLTHNHVVHEEMEKSCAD
jgi:hypothetical protein